MKTIRQCLQTGLLVSAATLSAQAGSFSSDFNSGLPAGATLYGTAVVEPTGGVGDSGCLKLTKAINGQLGSIVLDDLDGGQPIVTQRAPNLSKSQHSAPETAEVGLDRKGPCIQLEY